MSTGSVEQAILLLLPCCIQEIAEASVKLFNKKEVPMLLKKSTFTHDLNRNCHRCGGEFRVNGEERVCQTCRKPRQSNAEPLNRHLTLREKQIVDLVKQAKLNKEIAYILHLTEGTVKEYLNKIFRKLEVKNRTDLAVWCLTHPAECQLIRVPGDPSLPEIATVQ